MKKILIAGVAGIAIISSLGSALAAPSVNIADIKAQIQNIESTNPDLLAYNAISEKQSAFWNKLTDADQAELDAIWNRLHDRQYAFLASKGVRVLDAKLLDGYRKGTLSESDEQRAYEIFDAMEEKLHALPDADITAYYSLYDGAESEEQAWLAKKGYPTVDSALRARVDAVEAKLSKLYDKIADDESYDIDADMMR